MIIARYKDITGKKFGDLTAARYSHSAPSGNAVWDWLCTCGQEVALEAHGVVRGHIISCGCRRSRKADQFHLENGWNEDKIKECSRCHTPLPHTEFAKQYRKGKVFPMAWCKNCTNECQNLGYRNSEQRRAVHVLAAAKARAKRDGVPFDLKPEDILPFPKICPILGLVLQVGGKRDLAPSLDKIIPELGYIKSNIAVISQRANRLKNDATADELRHLLSWRETVEHEQITPS